jgi:predicted DNA-binding transcriptional regulator YafY
MARQDNPKTALQMIRIAAIIVQHQPSMAEMVDLSGFSPAMLKRHISALRSIGCDISVVRRGTHRYYLMRDGGVFDIRSLARYEG